MAAKGSRVRHDLALHVQDKTARSLAVYDADGDRVKEDAGKEEDLRHGGYGQRQVLELVQNGADQLLGQPGGAIRVVLTEDALYCANQGDPIEADGITSLLHTNISPKRGAEIGRFGLGFKSVLGVSDSPQFFSEAVSFGFDAEWARSEIEKIVPGLDRYPVLRVARVLDKTEAILDDPLLGELLDDSTTVIRLPRDAGASTWLTADLQPPDAGAANQGFPAEFLIFSPHVGEVVLEDRVSGLVRRITVEESDGVITVGEAGESVRRWRVFSASIEPSAEAREEAGELSGRDSLPVVWAVPVEGKLTVGQFWAFFPLQDETTLSGIANAPWKINDDRVGLLPHSLLNKELLSALADLVLENIAELQPADDPGWILDLLPARGREVRSWGDDILTRFVYDAAPEYSLVADQTGTLQPIRSLAVAPAELPTSSLELWNQQDGRPDGWSHPSTNSSPTRRSRVDRLLAAVGDERRTVDEWLQALLAGDPTDPIRSAAAIRVAADVFKESEGDPKLHRQVKKARILMADGGRLLPLVTNQAFLPSTTWNSLGLVELIHPTLAGDPDTRAALEALSFVEVTPLLELKAQLRVGLLRRSKDDWDRFWELVRAVEPAEAAALAIEEAGIRGRLQVRSRAGDYRPWDSVLLPGPVVPESGRDEQVAVDVDFHRRELDVLRRIGLGNGPARGFNPAEDSLIGDYRDNCRTKYQETVDTSTTPQWDRLEFTRDDAVGPLEPLRHLGAEGRAAFTAALLAANDDWSGWSMRHETQEKYPPKAFLSPYLWALRTWGMVNTTEGLADLKDTVGPGLADFAGLLPVCDLDSTLCAALRIPDSLEDIADRWPVLFDRLREITDDQVIGRLYAAAAGAGIDAPERIWCRIGATHENLDPSLVVVTSVPSTFAALRDLEEPAVLTPTEQDAERIVAAWGLLAATVHVSLQPEWIEAGTPTPVLDAFPTLRDDFRDLGKDDLELVPCSDLRLVTATEKGTRAEERDFVVHGSKVLYDQEIGTDGLVARLDGHFDLQLTDAGRRELVDRTWEDRRRRRLAEIKKEDSDARRLLKALGPDPLRKRLPVGLVGAVEELHGPVDAEQIAQLHLVVNGYDTLKNLREEFIDAGLHPPERWAGSSAAKKFVRELGFAIDHAGFPSSRRDATLLVPGPSHLPPLHDYQQEIVREIHRLITAGGAHPRGMLSLPTGAGKTRIAVQALVEAMVAEDLGSPVLWVAESDELCEQAVQAWSEVWRAIGRDEELTIGRLWGANEVGEAETGHQIVVATPDKLRARTSDASYQWLQTASCVVVDEAHTAITPEYTRLLEWQGISQRGGTTKTRAPLIGLTATPFRGTSEEQTRRLANRFGKLRLDRDIGEKPYEEMQEMGVLAQVEGEVLEGGFDVDLDEAAEKSIEEMRNIPKEVFREIASDVERNRIIVESIKSKEPDWPILVFAVSTEHAHTLAALLSMEGITAASIDHKTDGGLRRRLVQDFREGRIRVLTNYGVLSQGFDAPKTRAIYITRPTFSPNVYQQMIGRGLRGPLNGGEEHCLIVNVIDNWSRFQDQLAYREFEHLWERRG